MRRRRRRRLLLYRYNASIDLILIFDLIFDLNGDDGCTVSYSTVKQSIVSYDLLYCTVFVTSLFTVQYIVLYSTAKKKVVY